MFPLQKKALPPVEAKRSAFAVCIMQRALNAALADFKQKICSSTGHQINFNKTLNVNDFGAR
jgi:hypothetical protein